MTDKLQPCDRVFDRLALDDPDESPELAIVIGTRDHTCADHDIEDEGETVKLHEYGVNGDYADASTPVVTIAFTSWLNAEIPGWDDNPADIEWILERLETMADYGIQTDRHLYDYPSSRLSLRHRP